MTTRIMIAYLVEIYLIYGLSFVLLGVVALIQPSDAEELPISRHFWLLGAFGLLHGGKEFLDAWMIATNAAGARIDWIASSILMLSFAALFEFARRAVADEGRAHAANWVPLTSVWIYIPVLLGVLLLASIATDGAAGSSAGARYLLGFPGAVLGGLMLYRAFDASKVMAHVLGIALVVYGCLGGLIIADVSGFPAWLPTQTAFLQVTGVPVQLLRMACALVAMLALSVLVRRAARETSARAYERANENQGLANSLERRITERTAELQESEHRLKEAQRIAKIGSWELDLKDNTLTWSDEIYRMFEIDAEHFSASYEAFLEAVHPDDRALVEKAYADSLTNRAPYAITHRLRMADGQIKWVQERCETSYDADGTPAKSRGSVLDITSLKNTELALRESEGRLQVVMNNAADGIITIDEHGVINSFNNAASLMFGYTAEEILGENVAVLMPEPHRSEHDQYIRKYLDTGKSGIIGIGLRELTAKRSDGTEFPIELSVAEAQSDERRFFVGSLRDITERKERQQQLQQAQKLKVIGQLTGGVAHDFNNLLSVMLGNLELLQDRIGDDDENQELLKAAIRAGFQGADLTRRLLAFSRRQPLAPKPTDINKCVLNTTELMRHTLGEDVAIETVLAGGLWHAMVDAAQLENAMLNLAINARDAMRDGGKLTIETANSHLDHEYADQRNEVTPGQYVMISLTDTGCGMPAEVLEKVFEPFFTTKDIGQGTGLGLSMVYGFVKQSGGHVAVYSEPGEGACVKLYLPRAMDVEAGMYVPPVTEQRAMPAGYETLLVVEDNEDVRSFVASALGVLGYNILEAADGPAALAFVEQNPNIDMVFADVVLPGGMNGRELVEKIQKRHPDIKVLYTSGYTENAIVHHGRLDAGTELLTKPYTRATLALRVRTILDD